MAGPVVDRYSLQSLPADEANRIQRVRFVDVADAAGLKYQWQIPGKRPLNILQTIGNGCAFLDYNGDGLLDILLVGSSLALYRGDGKGHFMDVTHETGLDQIRGHFLGCAVGDYDNDGYDDIYLSGWRAGALLHNERNGTEGETGRQGDRKRPILTPQYARLLPYLSGCDAGSGIAGAAVGNQLRVGGHGWRRPSGSVRV